jgi:hypothetical protein
MSNDDKVTHFPTTGERRWRNRLGRRAVPCLVTCRWLQFPEKSDTVADAHYMFVDAMTSPDGESEKRLRTLCISKEDLRAALDVCAGDAPAVT